MPKSLTMPEIKDLVEKQCMQATNGEQLIKKLVPDGVKDAELLMKAILKRLFAENESHRVKATNSEVTVRKLQATIKSLEHTLEDNEEMKLHMEREVNKYLARTNDLETKIAFLGKKWELMTGEVNYEMVQRYDPHTRAKYFYNECKVAKEETFRLQMLNKKICRQKVDLEAAVADLERLNQHWAEELLEMRRKDESSDSVKASLTARIWVLTTDFKKTEVERARLEKELAGVVEELAAEKVKVKELTSTTKQLDKSVFMATKEKGIAEVNCREAESVAVSSAKDKQVLLVEMSDLRAEGQKHKEAAEARRKELRLAEAQIRDLATRLEATENDLTRARERCRETESKLTQTALNLKNARDGATTAESELDVLRGSIDRWATNLKDVEDDRFDARETIKQLKASLEGTGKKLVKSEEYTKRLEKDLYSTTKDLERSRANLKSASQSNLGLTQELRQAQHKIVESAENIETSSEMNKKMHVQVKEQHGDLLETQAKVAKLTKELETTKSKLRASEENAKAMEESYNSEVSSLRKARDEIKKNRAEIRDLDINLRQSQGTLKQEQGNSKTIGQAYEDTAGVLKATKDELFQERRKVEALETQLKKTKDQLRQTQLQQEETEKNLAYAQKTVDNTRLEIKKSGSNMFKLEGDFRALKKTNVSHEEDLAGLRQSYQEVCEELKAARAQIKKHEAAENRLTVELAASKKDTAVAKAEAEKHYEVGNMLTRDLTLVREKTTKSGKEIYELTTKLRSADADQQSAESDRDFFKEAVRQRAADADRLMQQSKAHEEKALRLASDLDEMRSKQKKLEIWVDSWKQEEVILRRELAKTQQKLSDVESMNKKISADLRSLKTKADTAETSASEEKHNVLQLLEEMKKRSSTIAGPDDDPLCKKCGSFCPAEILFCRKCGEKRPQKVVPESPGGKKSPDPPKRKSRAAGLVRM